MNMDIVATETGEVIATVSQASDLGAIDAFFRNTGKLAYVPNDEKNCKVTEKPLEKVRLYFVGITMTTLLGMEADPVVAFWEAFESEEYYDLLLIEHLFNRGSYF